MNDQDKQRIVDMLDQVAALVAQIRADVAGADDLIAAPTLQRALVVGRDWAQVSIELGIVWGTSK